MSEFTTRQSACQQHALGYEKGFSLVELMIVIAIMGIIVAIASPSIATALERQRNQEATQTLVAALKEAKTESLFRRQDIDVTVTPATAKVSPAVNITAVNKVSKKPETIKSYALPKTIPLATAKVTFKSNKTISSAGNKFEIATFCNKKKTKKGRTVKVDYNGNISVDKGRSQC